jgi:hypothetical protein
VIGAGVSSVLIPWFTNRWQDHKKKIEIKVELVSKMSEIISNELASGLIAISRQKEKFSDAEWDKWHENKLKWLGEANIIRSKLQGYYRDAKLARAWFNYYSVISEYHLASLNYFTKGPTANEALKEQLETIRDFFLT